MFSKLWRTQAPSIPDVVSSPPTVTSIYELEALLSGDWTIRLRHYRWELVSKIITHTGSPHRIVMGVPTEYVDRLVKITQHHRTGG